MESTCSFDGLEMFDGESTSEPSLGIYCGQDLPEPIYTTGRYATLRFKTDGSVGYSGFSADFTAMDEQPMSTSSSVETTPASSEGNIIWWLQWAIAIQDSYQKPNFDINLANSPMSSIEVTPFTYMG